MSRAFVTDKEDWIYCAKAGERCLHASADRDCRRTDCQYYDRVVAAPAAGPKGTQQGLKVVRRESGNAQTKAAQGSQTAQGKPAQGNAKGKSAQGKPAQGAGARSTKRASIKPPRKWGGRSG